MLTSSGVGESLLVPELFDSPILRPSSAHANGYMESGDAGGCCVSLGAGGFRVKLEIRGLK